MKPISSSSSVRDRLLVALTNPEVAGSSGIRVATLMAHQEPLAVLEWLGTGKGLVLIDNGGVVDGELASCLDRVLGAQEKGFLFVAVAGGGPAVDEQLRAAAARAKAPAHLGLYHADDAGHVAHVAGRRMPELDKVGRGLPECDPLSPEDIEAIGERGRRERQSAIELVRTTTRRFPYATAAMMAACFLVFAMTSGGDERSRRLFDLLSNRPEGIQHGEYWRLLTYAFVHGHGMHLVVNMLSLYSLGGFLEPLLGRRRLALLCAVTAVAGGLASTWLTRAPSVGASGAVWGLLGATLGLLTDRRSGFPPLLARVLRQRLLVILVLNVGMSFLPHIDRYCHFGGGLAGFIIAMAFGRTSARRA